MTVRQRLEAFGVLDEAGALPGCTCRKDDEPFLEEEKQDAVRAYIIRSVAQRHYRVVSIIAQFPETYYAVRDAIDAKAAAADKLSEGT